MAQDTPAATGIARDRVLDPESRRWLDDLRSPDPQRQAAVEALFDMLHRATRHEAFRRRDSLPDRMLGDLDDLARQAAGDAVAAVLRKLDGYRGASRFTTWAYKFAILEIAAALRREAWRGRSITIDDRAWDRLTDPAPLDPHAQTEVRELLAAIERSVASDLTSRQRDVFVAVVILEVPIDVVADRDGSSRGAVYKVLHDARRKLRAGLIDQGWPADQSERPS
jgi:RNA polymerase sigma-70 factor (ECF subfamily)